MFVLFWFFGFWDVVWVLNCWFMFCDVVLNFWFQGLCFIILFWIYDFSMYDLWCCFELLFDGKGGGWGFELGLGRGVGHLPPWVRSGSSKTTHRNGSFISTSPPFTWRTVCGWYYASSNFTFTDVEGDNLCLKCKAAQEQRGSWKAALWCWDSMSVLDWYEASRDLAESNQRKEALRESVGWVVAQLLVV